MQTFTLQQAAEFLKLRRALLAVIKGAIPLR